MADGEWLTSRAQRHYRLLHVLDQGGAAAVFAGVEVDSGQRVALKLWHNLAVATAGGIEAQLAAKEQQRQQFAQEMRICAQLQHRHMVTLLDQGQTERGQFFAVFPLLPGHTLKEWLIMRGSLSVPQSGEVMVQLLRTLGALHAQGVAHGDVKPGNIMVDGLDTGMAIHVTLLDFGNAQSLAARHGAPVAAPNLCSPAWSAPEQLRGALPDTRCDLYAWGLLFLTCLTGQAAVCGHNVAELCQRQLCAAAVPIPASLTSHPLARLLMRVLHKDCLLREADAGAVLLDFLGINLGDLLADLQVRTGCADADADADADGCGLTQPCGRDGLAALDG